eukprot:4192976-Pleurochrysis_carterae.AAC.2
MTEILQINPELVPKRVATGRSGLGSDLHSSTLDWGVLDWLELLDKSAGVRYVFRHTTSYLALIGCNLYKTCKILPVVPRLVSLQRVAATANCAVRQLR